MSDPLLDSFPCAAAVVDERGNAIDTNEQWRETFGTSTVLADALAQRLLEHTIREVFAGHVVRATPIIHAWHDRWYQTRVTKPVSRADGVVVSHEDVTAFKSSQHQARELLEATSGALGPALLRAVSRQLARLCGSRYAFVAILDRDRPQMLQCTAFWDEVAQKFEPDFTCQLAGTPCERVIGKSMTIISSGVGQRFPEDEKIRLLGIEGYLGMPLNSPEGEPMGLVAAAHTARLDTAIDPQLLNGLATRAGAELSRSRAEHALRDSQERLKLALVGTDDGVFDWDIPSGRVRGNARLTGMLGYMPAEVPDMKAWEALAHPDDRELVNKAIIAHFKGETPLYKAEIRMRAKDGSWRWVLDRGKVVERDEKGRAIRMTGLHTDIEDRKRLETQVQISGRMASVGTLAATLAHEMNTPLSYLATGLTALSAATDVQGREEALEMAREGAQRIRQVVSDVKTFSHVDPYAARQHVDITEVVERAVRLARHLIEPRGRLEVSLPSNLPRAFAHDAQLSHVFLNLLVNAAQSLPNDGKRHVVRVIGRTDEKGWILIEVQDTGHGISAAVGSHIFEPFFTTRPAGEGTGLGLALCQNVVSGLGGEITFTSVPGDTRFKVSLPPAEATKEAAAPVRPPPSAPPLPQRSRKVLVIDDHTAMGTSLQLMLRGEHEVDAVTSAEAALERMEAVLYDVILCDVMMPGVTGMDLYRRVLEFNPRLAERFVFMTGGATTASVQRFLDSSRRRVLEKPFASETLRAVLRD
jgi:two-component system NtrC family sensor kinase